MKLSHPAIDSLKLFINLGKVKLTEEGKRELYENRVSLPAEDVERLRNGEVELDEILNGLSDDDFKRKAYIPKELKEKGITVRLMVVSRHFFHGNGVFLEVLVNSKILMEDYFKGITRETVKVVWKRLNELGLFYVSFEDFLSGLAVDVDFKVDIDEISEEEFRRFISLLNSIKEGEIHTGLKNLGLQYGYRHKKSGYISYPFIKMYYKPVELLSNSPDFLRNFLDVKGMELARIEGTVKNKKHFQSLGIPDNELGHLLELPDERIVGLLGGFLRRYVKFEQLKGVGNVGMRVKPTDLDFMLYVKRSIKSGMTLEMLESELRSTYKVNGKNRASILRKVSKLRKVYKGLLESEPDLKVEKKFFQFLDLILGN
jgi:hypothetical protein